MAPRFALQIMQMMFALLRTLFANRADLAAENLALRQQLAILNRKSQRPRLNDIDRAFWAAMKDQFENWAGALVIVKPATVVRWHRDAFRRHWAKKSAHLPGRPAISKELRDLIVKMANANPTWGSPRVHGELLKLGIEVSDRTVARYMPTRPKPASSQAWRTFLQNHMSQLVAVDFFTVPTVNFKILFAFVVLSLDRREVVHFNVTQHPTAQWTAQQIVEAFPYDTAPRYLMRDRDGAYGDYFVRRVAGMGIKEVKSAPHSPWQNPYVERMIGSIRRDCLDHVVVLDEWHLCRILRSYFDYYHRSRTHLALSKDCPEPRSVQPPDMGNIVELPEVGGLHLLIATGKGASYREKGDQGKLRSQESAESVIAVSSPGTRSAAA